MADLNPAEIDDFLQRYHTRTYGYSQGQYPDYYAHEPRRAPPWAPPLTGHDLLDEDEYSHYADHPQYGYSPADDHDDDAQSAYTTAPTVTTTRSGTNQSARSIFSSRTYSTTRSTAPSLRNNNHNNNNPLPFHQQSPHPSHTTTLPTRPDQLLWCEFATLTACPAAFSLADEAGWIAHHAQHHLRDSFPARLMCWFCDHVPFVCHGGGGDGGGYANFVERMQHVRAHILGDHRLGVGAMRRDLHLVEHVWTRAGLSEGEYRRAMEYDETPDVFRLPGEGEGGRRVGVVVERERAQYYDLDRERRRAERRLKGGRGRR